MKSCKRTVCIQWICGFICFCMRTTAYAFVTFLCCSQDTYINCLQHSIVSTSSQTATRLKDSQWGSQSFLFISFGQEIYVCTGETCTLFNWLSLCFYFFYFYIMHIVAQLLPRFFLSRAFALFKVIFTTHFRCLLLFFCIVKSYACIWVNLFYFVLFLQCYLSVYLWVLLLLLYLIWMKQW